MSFIETVYSAEVVHESVETPHSSSDSGVLASLGINASDIAFQFLNFVIVASIIWFLILKPVTRKMVERQKIIDDSLKNAKEIENRLNKSHIEYQERIDQAKIEGNKILESATEEAQKLKEQMKQEATGEIEELVNQAKKKIQLEKEHIIKGIKEESATLLTAAVEKILGKRLDLNQDKEIIQEMTEKMK